jgi:AcrR family transcriptional regulator
VESELEQLPIAIDLPVAGQQPRRRADAVRNHERVLCTAARLFAERGPDLVSMELIASEAGVGKGTLFRRFGDRPGLCRALLSERESALQDGLIRGPAPLGPGAPPRERLVAFGRAYLEFLERNGEILIAAEDGAPGYRLANPVYALYRTHVTLLLRQAGLEDRAEYLSDVLLGPLAASTYAYHRRIRGLSLDEVADGYEDLVARLLDSTR